MVSLNTIYAPRDPTYNPIFIIPTRLPQLVGFIVFDIVRLLLDYGANPNKKVLIYGNITRHSSYSYTITIEIF